MPKITVVGFKSGFVDDIIAKEVYYNELRISKSSYHYKFSWRFSYHTCWLLGACSYISTGESMHLITNMAL